MKTAWAWYRTDGLDLVTSICRTLCGLAFMATVFYFWAGWDPWESFGISAAGAVLGGGIIAGAVLWLDRDRK